MSDAASDRPPPWADPTLSRDIGKIGAMGESQSVEFKAEVPAHMGNIAKEIAAFATSGDGTVYVGISDRGEIVGIHDGDQSSVREKLRQRVEGLCATVIQPHVTPTISFAVHDGRVVMAIGVTKGGAPIYYAGNIPYLRQISSARPLTPQEVIDAILAWDCSRNSDPDPSSDFLSSLASLVVEVQVYLDESATRRVNPWAEQARWTLRSLADRARDVAIETPGTLADIRPELEAMADALDVVGHERPAINPSRYDILQAADEAMRKAALIRNRWLPARQFTQESIESLRATVRLNASKLSQIASRAEAWIEQGRLDELRSEAAAVGIVLLKAATFGLGVGDDAQIDELTRLARALRELETRTIYVDGGRSMNGFRDDLLSADAELQNWIVDVFGRRSD